MAATADIPDHFDRIRIAHRVPAELGTIEVLDYVFPDFLPCANPPPAGGLGGLLEKLFLPRKVHAATVSHGGAGGAVQSFSPFVAVDIGSGSSGGGSGGVGDPP